ncbi:hypothetical protein [Rhodovulum sp. PH10]|uniref:hypothetical protein n=1 Tax=Rhodovulum sp. PH10 TaxID=1187851 RepID=UPI0012F7F07B|nr:hypothetical protein [Rhodovulum sp. PH10]
MAKLLEDDAERTDFCRKYKGERTFRSHSASAVARSLGRVITHYAEFVAAHDYPGDKRHPVSYVIKARSRKFDWNFLSSGGTVQVCGRNQPNGALDRSRSAQKHRGGMAKN